MYPLSHQELNLTQRILDLPQLNKAHYQKYINSGYERRSHFEEAECGLYSTVLTSGDLMIVCSVMKHSAYRT